METRTYSDLLEIVQSLCGIDAFATVELPRIKALINRRATKAYRATDYWPRFLHVGEERVVASSIIPYEESGLDQIDTFLMVHVTAPFVAASAQRYTFHVGATGATLVCGTESPASSFVTYKAVHDTIYGSTGTDTTVVPKEWFDYLAHGTYADFLRSEGQQEKAALADAEAVDILIDELLRVDSQRPSFLSGCVSTNANMQAR